MSETAPGDPKSPSVDPGPHGTAKQGGSPLRKRVFNRAPRETIFKDVLVELPHGVHASAVARNVSATGARVDFDHRMSLPATVRISISSLGIHCTARVVWQDERSAGLEFL